VLAEKNEQEVLTLESEITIFSWHVPSGGLLKTIHEEYKFFKKRGYKVNVIFFMAQVPPYYDEIISDLQPVVITKSTKLNGPMNFLSQRTATDAFGIPVKAFFSVSRLLLKSKQHVIAHELASGFTVFFYLIFNRNKVVVVLHDDPLSFALLTTSGKLRIVTKLVKFSVKQVLRLVKILVATTPYIKESLSKEIPSKTIVTAEYGINICDNAPDILDRKDVLVMTKWTRQRKPEKYLQIARDLGKDIKLVLAGHWDEPSYLDAIKNMAEELNSCGANIEIRNDLMESEVDAMYHNCRVFLRLSFFEKGTGQGILDAIGHGCPLVIGRELGGLSGLEDEVHGYIVDSNNSEDIVEKIRRIFESNEVAQTFSSNVYKFATKHTWNDYGKALERVLFGGSDGNL